MPPTNFKLYYYFLISSDVDFLSCLLSGERTPIQHLLHWIWSPVLAAGSETCTKAS